MQLADRGMHVALVSRNPVKLQAVADEICAYIEISLRIFDNFLFFYYFKIKYLKNCQEKRLFVRKS